MEGMRRCVGARGRMVRIKGKRNRKGNPTRHGVAAVVVLVAGAGWKGFSVSTTQL